jgi:hypothetical protein
VSAPDDERPLASALWLRRAKPTAPMRVPVVPVDMLIPRMRPDANPFRPWMVPLVALEVIALLIAVFALAAIGRGPLWAKEEIHK